MTIGLFGSIFVLTSEFPANSQPQQANLFAVRLSYSALTVRTVSIAHLTGPTISGSSAAQTAFYLHSQQHPSAFPAPFTLSAGLGGSSVWQFGQNWTLNVASYGIQSPDNLTVSILSNGQLLYSSQVVVLVPGPYFTSAGVLLNGTSGSVQHYNLTAHVVFASSSANSVTVSLLPLGGVASQALIPGPNGLYYYNGNAPILGSPASYDLILTATDAYGLSATYSLVLTVP